MRRALESNGPADSLDCYLRRLRRNGNRVVRYVEAAARGSSQIMPYRQKERKNEESNFGNKSRNDSNLC